jgi:hypothetical protein
MQKGKILWEHPKFVIVVWKAKRVRSTSRLDERTPKAEQDVCAVAHATMSALPMINLQKRDASCPLLYQ